MFKVTEYAALSYLSSTFKSKFTPKEVAAKEAATSEYLKIFLCKYKILGSIRRLTPYTNVQ